MFYLIWNFSGVLLDYDNILLIGCYLFVIRMIVFYLLCCIL